MPAMGMQVADLVVAGCTIGRQTNHVNINELNKIENKQRQRDGLQDMISVKAMGISQYLKDYFEDGDVPYGLLSS